MRICTKTSFLCATCDIWQRCDIPMENIVAPQLLRLSNIFDYFGSGEDRFDRQCTVRVSNDNDDGSDYSD